eukprot:UN04202
MKWKQLAGLDEGKCEKKDGEGTGFQPLSVIDVAGLFVIVGAVFVFGVIWWGLGFTTYDGSVITREDVMHVGVPIRSRGDEDAVAFT